MKLKTKPSFIVIGVILGLLLINNLTARAFTETKTGSVESSMNLGSGSTTDLISQWLVSQSPDQGCFGCWALFQKNLLAKVIEQAGQSNYPATYQYITNPALQQGTQFESCMAEATKGIFTCLELSGVSQITAEVSNLKTWLDDVSPSVRLFLDSGYINNINDNLGGYNIDILANITDLTCKHTNNYIYAFQYNIYQDAEWIPISDTTANKCEDIKLSFSPDAEWLAAFTNLGTKAYHFRFESPPTDFLACADQTSCLSEATEHSLTTDTFGRGAQKVPADFVAQTEKSLTSPNAYMKCTDGVCVSYTSGSFPLAATAPASSYFGQCRGYGATINTPEVAVPAVTSSTSVNIVNRAPVPTVTFAKNPIVINEEVDVTCDIVDPDECSDKIVKVKWICTDSNGNSSNCDIWKAGTGEWMQGTTTQDLVSSEQTNPFRATAKFRASQGGNYAVTCEATDNDANNPLTGTGIAGIEVVGNCGEDGVCNPNCNPPDPDCAHCGPDGVCVQGCNPCDTDCPSCVIAAHSSYCALLSEDEGSEKVICSKPGEAKYFAYFAGEDPVTFKWKCFSGDSEKVTTTPNYTCTYNESGSFLPSLSIVDKNGVESECVTQTSATMKGESSCQISAREAGTNDDYSAKLDIAPNDQIEARVEENCISDGIINWDVTNGTVISQNENYARIKFDSNALTGGVKAYITTPDGKQIECTGGGVSGASGGINVEIKEKIQIGT